MRILVLPVFVSALLGFAVVRADDPSVAPTFTEKGHTTDTLDIVRSRVLGKQAVLIDVRERNEWDDGHLKVASLIPMSAVRAKQLTPEMKKKLPKDKPIYCHCRSGGRVLVVSKLLREQGYDVRPLQAGYEKLLAAGFAKSAEE